MSDIIHEFEHAGVKFRCVLSYVVDEGPLDVKVIRADSDVQWVVTINAIGWREKVEGKNQDDFLYLLEQNIPRLLGMTS